jgi:hypothetical protein
VRFDHRTQRVDPNESALADFRDPHSASADFLIKLGPAKASRSTGFIDRAADAIAERNCIHLLTSYSSLADTRANG